jgi:CMP-N-acetylneuraminic acid synthetase
MKKVFCFIPAKAASTRLKKKNILKIKGKEAIYYPLEAAKKSNLFNDEVIVSTESDEIKLIAEKYGASVPYLRDKKLAVDPYGVKDVLLDFLERFEKYRKFEDVFITYPTAVLMTEEDIIASFEAYCENNFRCLLSVTETEHNALRSVLVNDKKINPIFEDKILLKSQELEPTYRINGSIIIVNIQEFLKTKTFFGSPLGAYIMPQEKSIDIDTEFDYKLAKYIFENK